MTNRLDVEREGEESRAMERRSCITVWQIFLREDDEGKVHGRHFKVKWD